jgi:hypothetical protein
MTRDYPHDLSGEPDFPQPESSPAPPAPPAPPVAEPPVESAVDRRQVYLAEIRAGLPSRLGYVLTWLEEIAAVWEQDTAADPRFPATDVRAQNPDPYEMLDDAAARIEFSFVTGERDLGWRDGLMISSREFGELLAALDNQIWILEHPSNTDQTLNANVAGVLRSTVATLNGYRSRTVAGYARRPATTTATATAEEE